MGSDRARRTYDETRQYRRVVPQQGRVVLEADINESSEIFAEEARRDVLDILGPQASPPIRSPTPTAPAMRSDRPIRSTTSRSGRV